MFAGHGSGSTLRRFDTSDFPLANAVLIRISPQSPFLRSKAPLMLIEIERKFLVAEPAWQNLYTSRERLRDGLIAATEGLKVRVRLYENRATLAVKTKQVGFTRAEYEYEIPMDEGEQLLALHCGNTKLVKTRYYVPYRGFTWEVDVYEEILSGVILAEVELSRADVDLPLPPWIGREVTGEPEYKKINMLKARLAPTA